MKAATMTTVNKIRLNKFIAASGITSRRKADELIQQGRCEVNNKVISELGFVIDPEIDKIKLDGEVINIPKHKEYYLLNKPAGYVSTAKDEKNRPIVTDLIKTNTRLFPVGRLDYDTTGVLVLTNDGDFCDLMLHPKNLIIKEYQVTLNKEFNKDLIKIRKMVLEDGVVKIDEIIPAKNSYQCFIKLHSGKNHIVKRIFEKLGYRVVKLNRISFAGLVVSRLKIGNYRKLSYIEIDNIKKKYVKD